MAGKILKLHGIYWDFGKIRLTNQTILEWSQFNSDEPLSIPYGSEVNITIDIEERDYLNGRENIVWATYSSQQAEIIRNALLSQNITCELANEQLNGYRLFQLHIPDPNDIKAAVDFIWREKSGLRLKPDWQYRLGTENISFKKWIDGS